ncbi:hypothetical protein Taro_030911 [Colocasia esculenta]|uniref:Uncharacterized protein n=1 Tax=Colocasia esculenta TaxID=4460 RepID=A0A843VT74_COLES|nr:hypothetical protein [Colocasia esculenta]
MAWMDYGPVGMRRDYWESLFAPPAYVSSSTVTPHSGRDDIRTHIWEELSQQLLLHLGALVEHLAGSM